MGGLEALLKVGVGGIFGGVVPAGAVAVQDDIGKVFGFPALGGGGEVSGRVPTLRAPGVPLLFAEGGGIFAELFFAGDGAEEPLVPEGAILGKLWRLRFAGLEGDGDGDERLEAMRRDGGEGVACARSPVVSDEVKALNLQAVSEIENILREGYGLAGTAGVAAKDAIAKSAGAIAAEVGCDGAVAGLMQRRKDGVPGAGGVWPAVQEDEGLGVGGAGFFKGEVEDGGFYSSQGHGRIG